MNRTRRALFIALICVFAGTAAAASGKGGSPSADEQAIRAADAQWEKAAVAKDLEGAMSFYAEDSMVLWPDAPAGVGREAVRAAWAEALKAPAFSISWRTEQVVVSRSGDLAYARGSYDETFTLDGRAVRQHGKFLVIWKKQANGAWRVAVDTDNEDAPSQPIKP